VNQRTGTTKKHYETQLIGRAQAGDGAAVRELIDLHKDRLFAFIWRIIRNHHDAEEICQDAFLKAFASLDSFSKEYRFSTWLFTIGYRVCLNRMRRKRALTGELEFTALPMADDQGASASLESEEAAQLRTKVWAAVDRLSTPQRATILLFYRHEMGCQEIARILELPIATVKSHLHRARNRLREMLDSVSERDLGQFRNLSGRSG
jgi:RNA polymerase sigma-70 factor (ECF subfamily)